MEQARIPAQEAETILLQAAAALNAHERGAIHRDLKPSNSQIDPEEKLRFWILDSPSP